MRDISQLDLFSTKSDLRIIKITKKDVISESDNLIMLKKLIFEHEQMYPNIEKWFRLKVAPGIKTGERVAYLGLNNEKPITSSVVKKGRYSKFCHLHIKDEYHDNNLGNLFFAMMALDIRNIAQETHFTLPESLWVKKRGFFKSFGFKEVIKADIQYRQFEEELKCSVPFNTLWGKIVEKLPKIIDSFTMSNVNIFNGLLMSIKPKYIDKLYNGDKVIEIRKRFNPRWRGCRATIYSSAPTQAIYGFATIKDVDRGPPNRIWEKYKDKIGCSREEFDDYTKGSKKVYAIPLNSFENYIAPLPLDQITMLIRKDLHPPQSYLALEKNKCWAEAVSIAELLHGRFQIYTSSI